MLILVKFCREISSYSRLSSYFSFHVNWTDGYDPSLKHTNFLFVSPSLNVKEVRMFYTTKHKHIWVAAWLEDWVAAWLEDLNRSFAVSLRVINLLFDFLLIYLIHVLIYICIHFFFLSLFVFRFDYYSKINKYHHHHSIPYIQSWAKIHRCTSYTLY